MELIDMRTYETEEVAVEASPENSPKYPYGLTITLEGESLDKMPGLAEMGDREIVHIQARGYIKAKRSEEMNDGEVRRSVEIQIVTLAIVPDDAEAAFNEETHGPGRYSIDSAGKREHGFPTRPPAPPGFGPGAGGAGGP